MQRTKGAIALSKLSWLLGKLVAHDQEVGMCECRITVDASAGHS